jgi:nuclear pore complex protein Nup98-Nup96
LVDRPRTHLPDEEIVDENGYWISPSQDKLDHMSLKELERVKRFRVGRKGLGSVEFDEPVDLSQFSNVMKQVPGRIVVIEKRKLALYPDETNKPEPHKELNVPATVTLYGVWAFAKDTRKPVKDPNHPFYSKHLKRLQNMPNAKFVSWEPENGSWVFHTGTV